jgi:hypothetical protein
MNSSKSCGEVGRWETLTDDRPAQPKLPPSLATFDRSTLERISAPGKYPALFWVISQGAGPPAPPGAEHRSATTRSLLQN